MSTLGTAGDAVSTGLEIRTCSMAMEEWLERYWRPERAGQGCPECPEHGRRWSCPPGVPDLAQYLGGRPLINLLAARVRYTEEERSAHDAEAVRQIRERRYDHATNDLMTALRSLRALSPGSILIGSGECRYCLQCTRGQGLPCAYPEELAYSFSALGVDLSAMSAELFGWPLLWSAEGLPEYQVILCALVSDTMQ